MDCGKYLRQAEEISKEYKVEEIPSILDSMDIPALCYHKVYMMLYQNIRIETGGQTLDALEHYMGEVNSYPLLTEKDEKKFFAEYQDGCSGEIKDLLIKTNLRLVINIAKKYINRHNNSLLQDLIEEGNIGLLVAVEKFDLSKNTRFATYAAYWIKHYIQEYLYKNSSLLKFSDRVFHKYLKYKKILKEFQNRNQPVDEELIKEELNVDDYTLMVLSSLFYQPLKLEEDNQSGYAAQENMYARDRTDDSLSQQMIHEKIVDTMWELSARERIVLDYRYGIVEKEVLSLNRIGEILGVSKQRVSQIEKSALKKLARKLKKENI